MASNINPYNIDGTFPVAGQDNPSQGFRDNFTNTKNNFLAAQNEINDLQAKVIVKSALTGQSISNDMQGTQLFRPQLSAWTQTLLNLGNVSSAAILDFNQANFQKITTSGSITVTFQNWPASSGAGALGYGVMRVWIHVSDPAHTVTVAQPLISDTSLTNYNQPTQTLSFDTSGDYLFDFSSTDGGSTYLIMDLTRNRAQMTDPQFYFNDQVNSTVLFGFGGGLSTAKALEQGQDKVSALGSYNSVGIGTLSLANVAYTQMDTGGIAGYSVTGARGNIQVANVQPVQSSDLIGYVNGLAFTGNGAGNVFQQVASIDFFATGSNVAYGLGGNIAFFTADDGGLGINVERQAMGIENDLSVKAYGNLTAIGAATIGGNTAIGGNVTATNNATIGGTASIGGNTQVGGSLTVGTGVVESGTYLYSLALTGAATIVANTSIAAIIIDSVNSAPIANANITLPSNPPDRQTIRITTAAPISVANVYGGAGVLVKWVPSNYYTNGNVSTKFTYIASSTTWYRS
jgi:hypothetical protein